MNSIQPSSKVKRSNLALPLLLSQQIRSDSELPLRQLDRRDRELGRTISVPKSRPLKQLWMWLEKLDADIDAESDENSISVLSQKVNNSISILSSLVLIFGVASGVSAILALCNYDGNQPVNIVFLLGFYFVVQVISLFLFFVSLFPGLFTFTNIVSRLNVGYVLSKLIAHFPGPWRDVSDRLLGAGGRHYAVFGRMQKWIGLYFSQTFSTSFFFGSAIGFLLLVSLSDIAFSWSSTLRVSSLSVLEVTNFLSWPWRDSITQAVPSLALIEASRYFRLENASTSTEAHIFGLWWPFLAMCLLVYGFLPRLILWLFTHIALERIARKTAFLVPGVSDVLDRMNNSSVALTEPSESSENVSHVRGEVQPLHSVNLDQPCIVFNWSRATDNAEDFLNTYSRDITTVFEVGGSFSTEHDQSVVTQLANDQEDKLIVALVKAWEPPRGDFLDFLAALRGRLGEGKPINVIPIAYANQSPADLHLMAWQAAFRKLNDPWVKLCSLEVK